MALLMFHDLADSTPVTCLIDPEKEVPKTIQLLAATTFVSEVDSPTLALIAPLLVRGLAERLTATRRKVAVIIDNSPSSLLSSACSIRLIHFCSDQACQ